jgi:hypothetical protein
VPHAVRPVGGGQAPNATRGLRFDAEADGFADAVVRELNFDTATDRLHVYSGGPGGLDSARDAVVPLVPGDSGVPAISAGDVNGDGFGDLAVTDAGGLVVYAGSTSGIGATPISSTPPPAVDAFAFTAVMIAGSDAGTLVVRPDLPYGTAGDVNGDGIPDLVTTEVTQLAFFPGGPGFPPVAPTEVVPVAERAVPLHIADFDGDGRADLAATTSVQTSNIYFTDDRLDIYPGTPTGFAPAPQVTIHETDVLPDNTLNFGFRLSGADYDRDGIDDLLVGAPAPFPTPFFESTTPAVFVFPGSPSGVTPAAAPEITGAPGFANWLSSAAPEFP